MAKTPVANLMGPKGPKGEDGVIDPKLLSDLVNEYLEENLTPAIEDALQNVLSSGGSVHIGAGSPPDFIQGAKLGDIYIDQETGLIYELEEG